MKPALADMVSLRNLGLRHSGTLSQSETADRSTLRLRHTTKMSTYWSAGSEPRVISLTSAPSKTQNLISFEGHLTKTGARAEQVVTKLHKVIKLTRYHVVLTKTLSDQSSSSTRSGIKKWWELILVKIFWHWSMISSDPSLVKTVFLRKFVCGNMSDGPFPQ